MTDLLLISCMAVAVLGIRLAFDLRPSAAVKGVDKWSQRFGLSVTDEVHPFLLRRRRAMDIGYAVGIAVGIEASALAQHLLDGLRWSLASGLATQASWLVCGGVGAVVGGSLGARLTPPPGPRIARARSVSIADYVDPLERALSLCAAGLALVFGLMPLLDGQSGRNAVTAAGAGVGSVVLIALAAAVARATVGRSQPAGSTHLLAWSDALRSETVRNALAASGAIAVGTLVVSLPASLAAAGVAVRRGDVALWTFVGVVGVVAAFWIRSIVSEPARYFLRRLWPATAAELAEHERPREEVQR